jgi:ribosomal protein S18 acetylase RimI-like enzyme
MRLGNYMQIETHEISLDRIIEYFSIPISFTVERILNLKVSENHLSRFELVERIVDKPYIKDYDSIDGNSPMDWMGRFDMSNWGLLLAQIEGHAVGGAVVAWKTKDLFMLEGRDDLAVLWDIRVSPEMRGRGVGSALFEEAVKWSRARQCKLLKIETQNINVPACKFYLKMGCELGAINRYAYPDFPDEIQLLWYKSLV